MTEIKEKRYFGNSEEVRSDSKQGERIGTVLRLVKETKVTIITK